MATTLEEFAYDLSLRSLTQQEALLNEVRARTGVLLAATAIAISLLGGRALDDGARTILDLTGVGLGTVSFFLSVYVLAPRGRFSFNPHGWETYEYFIGQGSDVGEAQRILAYWNREVWDDNQRVIDRMLTSFRWACFALAAAVVVWSVGLALQ
ncbi:MAG TPA: hypothetical protein VFL61_16080 [Gaiellaceae bacterium]|nr:hypothetical protein [Gaiellaceae bacterium]